MPINYIFIAVVSLIFGALFFIVDFYHRELPKIHISLIEGISISYFFLLDVVVSHSIFDYKRALSPKGILATVGGSLARVFKAVLLGPLISRSKKLKIVVWKPNKKEDMVFLTELLEAGKVVPVIDRRYPLSEVAEAFRYFEEGHHQGKIIITI